MNSNHDELKPEIWTLEEREADKPTKKTCVENPIFRDDFSLQSAQLSQKTIGTEVSYMDYHPEYDENGVLKKSELHRVTQLDVDKIKLEEEAKKIQEEIDMGYSKEREFFAKKQKLLKKRNELMRTYRAIEEIEEYELKSSENKKALKPRLIRFPGVKAILNDYHKKVSENKQEENKNLSQELILVKNMIKKDIERLQIEIEELNILRAINIEKLREAQEKLRECTSYDRVYTNYRFNLKPEVYQNNFSVIINEKYFQFQYKGLIDNE